MAARVAAELKNNSDVQVELVKGGFGEFSVFIDSRKVIDTNRFWYPRPRKIVNQIRTLLAALPQSL
jgi:hypothetical protein